jgi:hypothetical protein
MSAFHSSLFWITLNGFISVSQYTSDIIVVPCYMDSAINTPFLSYKSVAISFLAGRQCLFKHFRLVWWMYVHPLLWKPRFHQLLLVRCDWEIRRHLCGFALKESKPKPFSAFCSHLWAFSESILCKTCDNCDNLVQNSAWNLWKFTRNFWNCEPSSSALTRIITH